MSNAIAFSKPGLPVTVSAGREDGFVLFRVADKGAGIPPEVIEKVFNRFEGRGAGAGRPGVGLGLSLVKSIVELHGGTVALQSAQGEGTVVTCRFPLSGPKA